MGGQACVLYGAAEFSRDTDLAIFASPENLNRLRAALSDLKAEVIAVPPFDISYLEKGHAIHFRCKHPEASEMRLDVMSKMRGVDSFNELWDRRTTIQLGAVEYDLLALPDLIKAKKTQRDKDWPMIRRLVEANYFQFRNSPNEAQIELWLRELRTPEILISTAGEHSEMARKLTSGRPLLQCALDSELEALNAELDAEEMKERELDRAYWAPLMAELRELRRARLR
jgi:hypothetical protein